MTPERGQCGFTPGPWSVDGPSHNQIVWSDTENRVCFLAHSDGKNVDRDIATGNLIAAAPDLYAALVQVREACLFGDDDGSIGVTSEPYISMELFAAICTALSKATPPLQTIDEGGGE